MGVCSTDSCGPLKTSSTEKCPRPAENDLQLFPSCTLNQALNRGLACVAPFLSGLPYNSQDTCWTHAEEFTRCISKVTHECLIGNCPTILDPVPGLRSSYPTLRELKFNVKDKEDLVTRLRLMGLGEAAELMNKTEEMLCPNEEMAAKMEHMWLEGPGVLKVMKQFLTALHINVELNPEVCGEKLSQHFHPELETADVSRNDNCRIMNDFSNNIVHMLDVGCFPGKESYVRKATEIFREFGKRSSNCDKNSGRVCVTGDRVEVGEYIIDDNTFPTICASPLDDCMMMRYTIQSEGYPVALTTGVCHDSSYTMTCDDLEKYNTQPISNCSVEQCGWNRCTSLQPTEPIGCRQHEDDLQLFPQCTVRETLDGLLVCFSPYLSQLPFSSIGTCKDTVNGMASCFSKVFRGCLGGRCPTVLDHIPGLRSSYSLLRGALYEVKSIDDIVNGMRGVGLEDTADLVASMIPMMCPEDAEKSEVKMKWSELTDFPMIVQNFLASFKVNVHVPKLKDVLPCDPAFLSLIEILQTQLYNSFDRSQSHNDVCKAYDLFSRAFALLWNQECSNERLVNQENLQKVFSESPDTLSNMETVMTVFLHFLDANPRLPKCDEQRTCVSGNRVTVFGTVTEDNTFEAPCKDNEYLCMSESYVLMIEQTPVHIESGKCLDPHQAYICDDVKNYIATAEMGKVENCTITACNKDSCSPIDTSQPTDCEQKDIPFLPACSVNEFLEKMKPCASIYFSGLPYEENTNCRTNLDKMISCISSATHACLLGRCPTLLDDIVGLRASYQQIRDLLHQVSGVDDIIGRLRGRYYLETADYVRQAQLMLCPRDNEKDEALHRWRSQGSFNEMFNRMLETFGFDVRMPYPQMVLPCNETYFRKMAYRADAALGEFSAASNHQDICSSYTNFYNSALALVSENCKTDEDKVAADYAIKQSKHPEMLMAVPSRKVARALLQFWDFFKRNPKLAKCQ